MELNKAEVLKLVNGEYKWVEVDCCPICGSTEHQHHCGRCNKPMVRCADGKEYCPVCVPWERFYTGDMA
jgi:hypothetical protein